ncbi:UNVERIFIED_ORG: hypothetical protein J2791_006285 [Burkholderia contaminans]|nr:hypothetical protein [Burkholderia contaminans]
MELACSSVRCHAQWTLDSFFANVATYTFEDGVHIVGFTDHDLPTDSNA